MSNRTSGWKDQLVKYNNESFVYDNLGRHTTYRGMTTSWNKDGTLSNMGDKYSYIRRNIDGVVIERRESSTSSVISSLVDGNRLLKENGLTFIYILDKVVGFIYNNSRYYDPETCRFISPDVISIIDETSNTINGLNLYIYCNDNPIMYADPSGYFVISSLLIGLAIFLGTTTIVGATVGGISAGMAGENVFSGIGKGALNGLVLGGGISLAIGGFVIGGTTVLGSIMATYGLSISANMLEVAITQGKKSCYDGDSFWAGANDVNNAMFVNSPTILTGKFLEDEITIYGTRLFTKGWKIFKFFEIVGYSTQYVKFSEAFLVELKPYWTKRVNFISLIISYGMAAYQIYNLMKSIILTPDFENSKWILF